MKPIAATIAVIGAVLISPSYGQNATPDRLVLTAVCKDPQGYVYRYKEDQSKKPEEFKDGFKNSTWSFSWDSSKPGQATVLTQSSQSAGGAPESATAAAVVNHDGSVLTFVVRYERGAWVYTLFPESRLMFASRHMLGLPGETGTGSIFHARCEMSVK
ncbi:hypothetical protein [Achromobacter ruhlandii]|uniref:hypothetical protein n=1 Tax=Achromobacter ruhlandii TaxID=72557 RepID=UPI0012FE16C4|nr:hypothetical protein [Achromobacter ruhlandii]